MRHGHNFRHAHLQEPYKPDPKIYRILADNAKDAIEKLLEEFSVSELQALLTLDLKTMIEREILEKC